MGFEIGNKYGTRSSRAGVPNKSNEKAKEQIAFLIENNMPRLQKSLDGMKKVEFFNAVMQLMRYHIPTLKSVEQNTTVTNEVNSDLINKLLAIPEDQYKKLENE